MSKNVSRRGLMSGAAALPAVAVLPRVADAAGSPDAELLELGRHFESLDRQFDRAIELQRPIDEAGDRALALAPGRGHLSDEEVLKLLRRVEHELGGPIKPHPDDISDAMDIPMRRIMALPATTLTGLAVKARVARFACFHFYERSDDAADWHHLMARKLIDAVLASAIANAAVVS